MRSCEDSDSKSRGLLNLMQPSDCTQPPGHVTRQPDPASIFAVIVLYVTRPADSDTVKTLITQMSDFRARGSRLQVLLYDNTPGGQDCPPLPEHIIYHAAPRNGGIVTAYTRALELASRGGFSWMLTLDQDTHLPPNFLARMYELALYAEPKEEIGAIVPQLSSAGRLLSPVRIRPWGPSYLPRGFSGIARGEICAVNSASLFRVRALNSIGGFDPRFWLDCQDAYVYRQLHRSGLSVWTAGEIQIQHDLSLISRKQPISVDRFENFLQAESAFCDLYGTIIQRLALTGRLAGRLWRLRKQRSDAAMQKLTRIALKRRILLSRKQRIHEWMSEAQRHFS